MMRLKSRQSHRTQFKNGPENLLRKLQFHPEVSGDNERMLS